MNLRSMFAWVMLVAVGKVNEATWSHSLLGPRKAPLHWVSFHELLVAGLEGAVGHCEPRVELRSSLVPCAHVTEMAWAGDQSPR